MAIEMFAGKTGERLLVRTPVAEGSFADVTVATLGRVAGRAVVRLQYEGGQANGYPALSPVLATLDAIDPQIRKRIEATRTAVTTAIEQDREDLGAVDYFIDSIDRRNGSAEFRENEEYLLARDLDEVEQVERFLVKPPVCPRIMLQQTMQLQLPRPIFGPNSSRDLGRVLDVSIHNGLGRILSVVR